VPTWPKSFFISGIANTYGKQKAEEVINQVIQSSALPNRPEYSKEECLKICDVMAKSSDIFLQIAGNSLKVHIILDKSF
jgi:hypothetical protein